MRKALFFVLPLFLGLACSQPSSHLEISEGEEYPGRQYLQSVQVYKTSPQFGRKLYQKVVFNPQGDTLSIRTYGISKITAEDSISRLILVDKREFRYDSLGKLFWSARYIQDSIRPFRIRFTAREDSTKTTYRVYWNARYDRYDTTRLYRTWYKEGKIARHDSSYLQEKWTYADGKLTQHWLKNSGSTPIQKRGFVLAERSERIFFYEGGSQPVRDIEKHYSLWDKNEVIVEKTSFYNAEGKVIRRIETEPGWYNDSLVHKDSRFYHGPNFYAFSVRRYEKLDQPYIFFNCAVMQHDENRSTKFFEEHDYDSSYYQVEEDGSKTRRYWLEQTWLLNYRARINSRHEFYERRGNDFLVWHKLGTNYQEEHDSSQGIYRYIHFRTEGGYGLEDCDFSYGKDFEEIIDSSRQIHEKRIYHTNTYASPHPLKSKINYKWSNGLPLWEESYDEAGQAVRLKVYRYDAKDRLLSIIDSNLIRVRYALPNKKTFYSYTDTSIIETYYSASVPDTFEHQTTSYLNSKGEVIRRVRKMGDAPYTYTDILSPTGKVYAYIKVVDYEEKKKKKN